MLLNIFVETLISIFQDSLVNRKFRRSAFIVFYNIINIFTVTFDQFNVSLPNHFF